MDDVLLAQARLRNLACFRACLYVQAARPRTTRARAWERYSTPLTLTALFTALSATERASGADFGRVTALRGER